MYLLPFIRFCYFLWWWRWWWRAASVPHITCLHVDRALLRGAIIDACLARRTAPLHRPARVSRDWLHVNKFTMPQFHTKTYNFITISSVKKPFVVPTQRNSILLNYFLFSRLFNTCFFINFQHDVLFFDLLIFLNNVKMIYSFKTRIWSIYYIITQCYENNWSYCTIFNRITTSRSLGTSGLWKCYLHIRNFLIFPMVIKLILILAYFLITYFLDSFEHSFGPIDVLTWYTLLYRHYNGV